jgi:hypothetical protein
MFYGFYWKRASEKGTRTASEKGTRTKAHKELKENETKAEIPSLQLELCRMMF